MTPRERAEKLVHQWRPDSSPSMADDIERAIIAAVEEARTISDIPKDEREDELHAKLDREREYSATLLRQQKERDQRISDLETALRMFDGGKRQFDRPCFCRTADGSYCVGQAQCEAARVALSPSTTQPATVPKDGDE